MTKIPMSPLGYGCYALGGAYGPPVEVSRAIKLIELAFDLGIRFFDTADQYGSEEVLGKAVHSFRDKISIATKVGADPVGKGRLDSKHILASCEASLRRLNTDYLDLYQVHYDDPSTPVSEVVAVMELLREQGKIRTYGIGHLPLDRTKEYLEQGSPKTVLAEMNAATLYRYRELHPLQQQHNFGIIAFSVTGRGLLTGKITPSTQFSSSDIRRIDPLFKRNKLSSALGIMEKLAEAGQEINATPAQLAIAWVLNQPGVAVALTGPTDLSHLRENCTGAEIKLDPAWRAEICQFIRQEEGNLQALIVQEIWSIINTPVANYEDLIYVLEHSIESGLIPYGAGAKLFAELLQSKGSGPNLKDCQDRIKTLLEFQKNYGNSHGSV